jgi:hypothetical protein
MTSPVDQFLSCVEAATMDECTAFATDVDLDATVPNWRMAIHGDDAVRSEFGRWYDAPGRLEDVVRTPLPSGEMVQFVRTWEEAGTPHAVHQIHVIDVGGGRITADHAWCGGRWPASLLAEMAEAGA